VDLMTDGVPHFENLYAYRSVSIMLPCAQPAAAPIQLGELPQHPAVVEGPPHHQGHPASVDVQAVAAGAEGTIVPTTAAASRCGGRAATSFL
jgi:hypothetical protein